MNSTCLGQVVSAACKALAALAKHAPSAGSLMTCLAQTCLSLLQEKQHAASTPAFCSRQAPLALVSACCTCFFNCHEPAQKHIWFDSMDIAQVSVCLGAVTEVWHGCNRGNPTGKGAACHGFQLPGNMPVLLHLSCGYQFRISLLPCSMSLLLS